MSNQSGRSWYRFSSTVRPTPHSSRDPSPSRHDNNPPRSPAGPLPQPLSTILRPPPKELQEPKLSPVTPSRSTKHEPAKPRNEEEVTHQKNIHTLANLVHGPNKEQPHESDDVIMGTQGFITISCENKGAVMFIQKKGAVMEIQCSQSKTLGMGKGRRLQSSSKDEGGENKRSNNSKKHNDNINKNLPMDGYVNSNVQMVNGTVVYNSMETHHDPGVHLSLRWKPRSGNSFIVKDHGNGYNIIN